MGKALKKNQDYSTPNRMRWAAWGVVNIEALERMQRRNYINHVREELKVHGCTLECGGGPSRPFYRIFKNAAPSTAGEKPKMEWCEITAYDKRNENAFRDVCCKALTHIDPDFKLAQEEHNATAVQP